ncbi:ClbS/DfsB family four-helix bundle protein [Actibacterium sp. 188UL27-1]|uniref:ClbS/DfsB family four-helix bundle protein n=1 Tax=Actibacterium sp. 188UL27-1 TaxID=2786961 RepID=UPI00195B7146|nr:ClbS/DfsB family four-helix bundle protein [Actibacterium sp. 188UL27-1]MBM7066279.1 ClbS/DfsB family four-helix bundle protein [Actibacterium sp. 188UL27-1]
MPGATTKSELLTITHKEFARLDQLIGDLSEETALAGADDETSIKDTIGHRAHWITLFLGWYADGQAGRTVHIPAEGYKWSELKAYNAAVREMQADLPWASVVTLLRRNHAKLIDFITGLSQMELYGAVMVGNDKWTTGRYAEAAGASHYRSARKYITSCLKELQRG